MPFRISPLLALLGLLYLFSACTEPVEPVFQFETGFLLIDGRIADEPGYSEVTVARNELNFEIYTLAPIPGATVESISSDGEVVRWQRTNEAGRFTAPEGWAAAPGNSYSLRIETPAGEIIESTPEKVPTKVPFTNTRVEFEQEAYFSPGRDRFIPAFLLKVDIPDPAEEANFYAFEFGTFEMIEVCASCERARWRDGVCIPGPDTRFVQRWDYLCDAPCWVSSQGEGTTIISDEFSNGQVIEGFQAGISDYDRQGKQLFVVQQFNITKNAFEFNSVIRELAEGAGGLNAPLPAALVGNLTDVSDRETAVLGYVGTAGVTEERLFIDRESFGGISLPFDGSILLEPARPSPPQAPCEGGTRSRIRPEGWPE